MEANVAFSRFPLYSRCVPSMFTLAGRNSRCYQQPCSRNPRKDACVMWKFQAYTIAICHSSGLLQCGSFSLKRRTKCTTAVRRADESLLFICSLQTSQGLKRKVSWYVPLPVKISNLVGFHAKIQKCLGWQEEFKHRVSIFFNHLLISAMLVVSLSVTINKTPALALTEENLLFLEAWRAVDRAYVDKTFNGQSWFRYRENALRNEPMSTRDETYKAIKKMLSTLDDPFTRFLEPEKFKSLRSGTQGALTGVGLSIGYPLVVDGTPSGLVVVSSAPGGPANKAGILSGDVILAIDGESTEDMDIYDAADRLQGTEGSVVRLVIRSSGIETKNVDLRREKVKFSPVKSRLCEVSRSGTEKSMVGYIKLTSFNQNASGEVKNAIDTLRSNGVKAFVLDLRNNSGGLFPEGIEIAKICSRERYKHFMPKEIAEIPSKGSIQDSAMIRNMLDFDDPFKIIAEHSSQIPCGYAYKWFMIFLYVTSSVIGKVDGRLFLLDKGVIVYICDNRGVQDIYEADGSNSVAASEPLAVLVNKGTASASEILAGALKDNKRAVLFGERTFGKGKIQSVFELSDGSGIVVTVARYETPAHTNIDKVGIVPDHPLPTPFPEDEDEFCSCLVNPSSPCNLNPAKLFSR